VLLSISTTLGQATDLGFLLHKHPGRLQTFDLSVGQAHVFCPEATDGRCTAALLLEVDPIALVRGRKGPSGEGFSLGQYVNDRPYAASSMMSMALSKVFRTAMTGRCDARPELAAAAIPLEIRVPALPCRGGTALARRVFEPLGWQVEALASPLDEQFPAWGDSRYVYLRLSGTLRLADALNHLYVLLPVLDDAKHYWVSTDEVDKLVRAGGGWLASHPEKTLITRRYLAYRGVLTRDALARLAEVDDTDPELIDNATDAPLVEAEPDRPIPLSQQRRGAVLAAVRASGARRIGDFGCGEGLLAADLLADRSIDRVVAVDVSARTLEIAARRMQLDRMTEQQRARLQLFQSSLTYRDDRLSGLDAAVLMEVIEHVDPTAWRPGTNGVRPRGPRRGHRDHPQRGVQRALRDVARRHQTPSGPPLRMDPIRVSGVGRPGGRRARLWRAFPAGRHRRPGGRLADAAGRIHEGADERGTRRMSRELSIPELSLVVLIGVSGSGKSTFGRAHFKATEVISSDFCRGLVGDDENDQSATPRAFELLNYIVGLRLAAGRLTVVDATNVQPDARKQLVALAREHDVLPVAIVLDLPEGMCLERNAGRRDRDFGAHVIRRQRDQLRRGLKGLQREGFRTVHVLKGADDIDDAVVTRARLYNDLRHESGPFDVIGDIHGCRPELESLLTALGYSLHRDEQGRAVGAHRDGRRAVFVGDLVDRGPDAPGVLRLVMGMVAAGDALCVPGNHENKLLRALRGRNVQVTHGLAESLEQLSAEPQDFRADVEKFLDGLISHYVLDGGNLVVSHAGIIERYQGRASGRVREFCLYGQTTGETDEYGLPVRYPWAQEYRGNAMVLYGHTPVPVPEWINNTLCLDTGCVFGGRLTGLRYPEREVVSVASEKVYYSPSKPFPANPDALAGPTRREPEVLDITDVTGGRVIETAYQKRIGVRAENAAAALEVMSRFATDPRWLLYLPPTMSPVATSTRPDLLEHPDQAFDAFRADGVDAVVCEEKHMGSRAVVLVCRDLDAARARFGAPGGAIGSVWTRTGRPFFDAELTGELLYGMRDAVERSGLFDDLDTSWVLFDAELLPWSAKAEQLLRDQYAAVGAAARASLPVAVAALEQAAATGVDVAALLNRTRSRRHNAEAFTAAYRRYCRPTEALTGVRIAPFQLLASEGATYHERSHAYHLDVADRLVAAAPDLIAPTRRLYLDTTDPVSIADAITWWEELTAAGGEGMVVKPAGNLTRGRKGLTQPGLKVRGREYLRIIYGPDYTEPGNIERLRQRNLGHKRSLALREYALGLEALDRVARGEPLWRIHKCVFAVLALESEPVDPRL
jgi:protein phosphatase